MIAILLLALVEIIVGSVVMYAVGRILLPEMGLEAPPYSAWFWVSVFFAIWQLIKGVIEEATK